MDEKSRQDVTWDSLSVRLNRGPEVCRGIIHKVSLMTHHESRTLYSCLWNIYAPLCYRLSISLLWPPGSAWKHALLQPPLFSTDTSLSFHPKSIFLPQNNLILSLYCICLFLFVLDLANEVISVNISYTTHLIPSHPVALTESCWGDKLYSKKLHYVDDATL